MPSGTRREVILENLASAASKADLYIVSLTFSVLALSVQFAVPPGSRAIVELFQAIGWVLLVASGLAGVRLLANLGDRYYFEAGKVVAEEEPLPESGKALEASTRYARERAYLRWQERIEAQAGWLPQVQLWGFFVGVVCLVASRICLLGIFGG